MKDCINGAEAEGRLSKERADEVLALYDELEQDFKNSMHSSAAEVEAARRAYEGMKFEINERKRRELLKIKTWQRIDMQMRQFKNAKGEQDYGAAMMAHIDRDDLANFSNVEARRKAVLGRLHANMDQFLATFRRNIVGEVREKAALGNVVREVFGEDTGDQAAKELAKAWADTADKARLRFNAAGGRIPKRENWGMPQTHDNIAVGKAGFRAWRDFIIDKLDPAKMINETTQLPLTSQQLELALRDVYETIKTDGLNKLIPSGSGGGKALANRHLDHRFLVFKSADEWLAYNERFGGNDVFSVMMGHLESMSRDIASLEILGPNPQSTLRFMEATARKWAGSSGNIDRVARQIKTTWDMWGLFNGGTNAPIHGRIARGFAGTRQTLQSAQLGAAAVASITDLNTGRMARKMSGLPEKKMLGQIVRLLNPADIEDQKLAVRLGLIAENWSTIAIGQQRYLGEVAGPEISRRLADAVMRISGLSPWTQAGRWSFGMEFMGALADNSKKPFNELPDAMQETFKRYGIDAQRWDIMRATDLYDYEGATFLRPDDIANRTDLAPSFADDLALRLLEMIQSETEFAVPSTSLRGRAQLIGESRPGTVQGELLRSFAMYKSFSVTYFHTHIARVINQKNTAKKAKMAAELFLTTAMMGGLVVQLKEISKGRDPMPMSGPDFWGAAILQGGGLGIFGDFLFSNVNRFGQGLAETIAGPVVGFADDVRKLTLGNMVQAASGENTSFGAEAINFFKRYMPGASLWYSRLALERTVFDSLQERIDPDAHERFRRAESKARNERNQKYWWRPGKQLPDRAPDISAFTKEPK